MSGVTVQSPLPTKFEFEISPLDSSQLSASAMLGSSEHMIINKKPYTANNFLALSVILIPTHSHAELDGLLHYTVLTLDGFVQLLADWLQV